MIQFPETLTAEWKILSEAANVERDLRIRIRRDTQVEYSLEKLRVSHLANIAHGQELDAADTPPVVIETMAQYLQRKSPVLVDMIEGVMKEDGLIIVLGPAGVGKSSLAIQIGHSLLTGTEWLGQQVTPIDGAIGLLSYDQNVAIPVNWMSQMGVPADRVLPIDLNGKGNPLNVPEERARLVAAFKAAQVEVVIIDSFSAAYRGDQNDAGLVMAWYQEIKKFALTEIGAKGLIVLVHSTKASPTKVRGSTVHNDVADSMVVVSQLATGERKVEMEKYRAGLGQVEMEPVVVTSPDSVTHLVDVDTGAMVMAGMALPNNVVGMGFSPLPDTNEDPDTETDSGEEDEV